MSRKETKSTGKTPSLELIAARFAYASTAVTTLADILATIAAGIELKLLEESEAGNSVDVYPDIQEMDEQIEYLIEELRRIKKVIR